MLIFEVTPEVVVLFPPLPPHPVPRAGPSLRATGRAWRGTWTRSWPAAACAARTAGSPGGWTWNGQG